MAHARGHADLHGRRRSPLPSASVPCTIITAFASSFPTSHTRSPRSSIIEQPPPPEPCLWCRVARLTWPTSGRVGQPRGCAYAPRCSPPLPAPTGQGRPTLSPSSSAVGPLLPWSSHLRPPRGKPRATASAHGSPSTPPPLAAGGRPPRRKIEPPSTSSTPTRVGDLTLK